MHYVQLGYVLALIVFAVVLRRLPRDLHDLPWKTLSWFAIFQAIDRLLCIPEASSVNAILVEVARDGFWVGSYLFVLEFVRQSMLKQSRWAPHGWTLGLPVFALLLAQVWYPPACGPAVCTFLAIFGPMAACALIGLQGPCERVKWTPVVNDAATDAPQTTCAVQPTHQVTDVDTTPANSVMPVFCMKTLTDRLLGDEETALELIGMALERIVPDLEAAQQAAKVGDTDVLQSIAHKMKGTAAYLAADPLRFACDRVERAARSGDWTAIAAGLPGMVSAGRAFHEAASAIVKHVVAPAGSTV